MNYKILVYFSLIFLLLSCDPQNIGKSNKINFNLEERYQNTGFTLIYNESLDKIKKLDQRSFNIYHRSTSLVSNGWSRIRILLISVFSPVKIIFFHAFTTVKFNI